jgi:hypothetical protein
MAKISLRAAMLIAICCAMPRLATAGYGLDIVPNSTFSHESEWRHYGTDPVPNTIKHMDGVATTFGVDQIPGVIRDVSELHPHHQLIHETIQHLTGAIEYTPARSTAKPTQTPGATQSRGKAMQQPVRMPKCEPVR